MYWAITPVSRYIEDYKSGLDDKVTVYLRGKIGPIIIDRFGKDCGGIVMKYYG